MAVYDRSSKTLVCESCTVDHPTVVPGEQIDALPPVDSGSAGASARREYERRSTNRAARIREAHPHLGGLILAMTDEPQSTTAWARGAAGEEKLARRLDALADYGVRTLHDRRIPGTKANIDHIAVGPTGVFVVDAKRYKGRPHLVTTGALRRPRTAKLNVGSRDCTALVHGALRQVSIVKATLGAAGCAIPVRGMLCFVDADWPLIGGSFVVDGIDILWPKKAAERIAVPGTISPTTCIDVQRILAAAFPSA